MYVCMYSANVKQKDMSISQVCIHAVVNRSQLNHYGFVCMRYTSSLNSNQCVLVSHIVESCNCQVGLFNTAHLRVI